METSKKKSVARAVRIILAALEGGLKELREILVSEVDADDTDKDADVLEFPKDKETEEKEA